MSRVTSSGVSPMLVAVLVAAAAPLLAQAPPSRDSVARLPGVAVTASRGEQSILATPLAITMIGTSALRATSGFGADEVLKTVPGVLAQSRYGTSDVRILIRGFGARGAGDRSNAGTTRGIRVLIDGIPETEPDGRTSFDFVDLSTAEAVEVVRSNASSVWGNASGGVIHLFTAPRATASNLEVQPVFGTFGLARYVARASAPLGSNGTAFASYTNTTFEGWRAHSDARRVVLNTGATGMIGDRTRLAFYAAGVNNLSHLPGPLTQAQLDADPRQANATYASRDERRFNRIVRIGATADHSFDDQFSVSSTLYASPKYLQRSERGTFRDFTRYHVGGNLIGHAANTLSPTVASRLTVGVDEAYQDGAILFYALTAASGRGALSDNKGEGANNFGAFVQEELRFNDKLSLLAGARYDNVSYFYRSFLLNPAVPSDSRAFKKLTPKLGLSWSLNATNSVYANMGGGIEVPAGNETDPTPGAPPALLNALLDPIRSTTYEVGFKSVSAAPSTGIALAYDIALYNTEVTNEIVPYNGGRYYLTAAKARRSGAELGLGAVTSSGVFGDVALTFSRNKYGTYIVDSTFLGRPGFRADFSGNEIVGIPAAFANVELGAEVPGYRALRVKGGLEYVGSYKADDANVVNVPSYAVFNLTAELRNPIIAANGWGLRGFVSIHNLTDKKYVGSAFLNPDRVNNVPVAFEPGSPRSLVVSLTAGRLR